MRRSVIADTSCLIIFDKINEFEVLKGVYNKIITKYTGSLGVINKAKEIGVIDKIRPLIDKLIKTDFRISDKVIDDLLKRNNE